MRGSEENVATTRESVGADLIPVISVGPHTSPFTLPIRIFDQSAHAVFACNGEGVIIYWNLAATNLLGWTIDDVSGKNLVERLPLEEQTAAMDRFLSAAQSGEIVSWLDWTKCGERVELDASAYPLVPNLERFSGLLCIARRSSRQPVADLLENMIEGCQIIDFSYRYIYLNPSALRQSKRELPDLIGKRLTEAYPGIETTEIYAVLSRCLRERVDCRFENEFVFPNGAKGVFDLHIVPSLQGLVIYSIDMTEARRLSAQMRQARKVIAIGQLAAGAAHDLANLLTVVTGGSELLMERFPEHDANRTLALSIRDAAERCSDMVRQILAFRRQTDSQSRLRDLNQVIYRISHVLQQLVGVTIKVDLRLSTIDGAVNIHPTQLEQILMNLAVNARDAMTSGGVLTITTLEHRAALDSEKQDDTTALRFVNLTVADTGIGMSEEVLARIFEPFFTTKREGKGAGLGLMTVYSIVQLAGGSISVESSLGKGASFVIMLPIF